MGLFGSDIQKTIPHGLSPNEVIRRLKADLEQRLQQAYPDGDIRNLRQIWSGTDGSFTCSAGGREISGKMSVTTSTLSFEVDLPMLAGFAVDTDELADS